MIIANTLLKQW